MTALRVIGAVELLLGSTSAIIFYFAIRLYMWRRYYRNGYVTAPRGIGHDDKIVALIFALGLGCIWFLAMPVFLVWRHRESSKRRRRAQWYANSMVSRFQRAYIEEYDEHR